MALRGMQGEISMSDKTGIEWTEATWNPVTGCAKVSAGCKNCYAERDWPRMAHVPAYAGRKFTDVAEHPARLAQPLRWKRPRLIFVNSMSDLFHPDVSDAFIKAVFVIMSIAKHHTFQILTKRPERMRKLLSQPDFREQLMDAAPLIHGDIDPAAAVPVWPLPNVWLGVSAEDQQTANERVPQLMQTPAAVRWISAEPLLGPIDMAAAHIAKIPTPRADWVVVGGESGPDARPMNVKWARGIRDQCAKAGVPFLLKQWGEWSPDPAGINPHAVMCAFSDGTESFRVGKKAAGRLLDDRTHDEYPTASGGKS
jgi:protein gp37